MLPSPVGEGNWVSCRKSPDVEDSMLLWKSSKLTWGRKLYCVESSCSTRSGSGPGPFRPKENREWLLEEDALSIEVPDTDERFVWRCLVGLGISPLLLFLKQ